MNDKDFSEGAGGSAAASAAACVPVDRRLTAELVSAWLRNAQPRARLIYASGFTAGNASMPVLTLLREAQERGLVFLVQQRRRPSEGFDYLAIRSSRPVPDARSAAEKLFAGAGR